MDGPRINSWSSSNVDILLLINAHFENSIDCTIEVVLHKNEIKNNFRKKGSSPIRFPTKESSRSNKIYNVYNKS